MKPGSDEIETDEDLPLMLEDEGGQGEDADDDGAEPSLADILGGQDVDDTDLSMLTEAERAALMGDDEDEDGDAAADAGNPSADGAEAAPDPAAEGAPAQAAQPADGADGAQEQAAQPEQANGKLQERLTQIDADAETRIDEAVASFDDGDITAAELKARLAQINRETQAKATQARDDVHFEEVKTAFISEARAYLGENPGLTEETHLVAFDRHVRAVTGNPAYGAMTHRQKLEAAHRLYEAEAKILNMANVPPVKGAAKAQDAAQASSAKPKGQAPAKAEAPKPASKPPIVPTLAKVPAAAVTELSGGKWSALQAKFDQAGPAERERIMASLSERERDEFASLDLD